LFGTVGVIELRKYSFYARVVISACFFVVLQGTLKFAITELKFEESTRNILLIEFRQ